MQRNKGKKDVSTHRGYFYSFKFRGVVFLLSLKKQDL